MSNDATFREQYEWWASTRSVHGQPARVTAAEAIERLYAEAHPPRVTAADMWNRFRPYDGCDYATLAHWAKPLCEELAALHNADADDGWIEEAAKEIHRGNRIEGRPWDWFAVTILKHARAARAKGKFNDE